jgi:hypothetical protein
MLGYQDPKNPRDQNALNSTVNLVANLLLHNTDNERTLNTRARELADKFGVTEEQVRAFFDMRKNNYDETDAQTIRKGLDTIYG